MDHETKSEPPSYPPPEGPPPDLVSGDVYGHTYPHDPHDENVRQKLQNLHDQSQGVQADTGNSHDVPPPIDTPTAQALEENAPTEEHPTIAFAIPFPPLNENAPEKVMQHTPPFVLYSPLAAPLNAPKQGQKESMAHKAQRKWQTEEREAKEKGKGFKAKAVGLIGKGMSLVKNSTTEFLVRTPTKKKLKELRIIYPSQYAAEDIKNLFSSLLKKEKGRALRRGVVATGLLPFVLAFDVITFISGPFEVNAVWAASNWIGASRASAITSGVLSSSLPLHFLPSPLLDPVAARLHELCWDKLNTLKHNYIARPPGSRRSLPPPPSTPSNADDIPSGHKRSSTEVSSVAVKRGSEMGALIVDILVEQLGTAKSKLHEFGIESNARLMGEDLDKLLKKGANEFKKVID